MCFLIAFTVINISNSSGLPIQKEISRSDFYDALSSSDTVKTNILLSRLENVNTTTAKAYTGTLLMKKSGLLKSASKKLSFFKQGKLLLQQAIEAENSNSEFRFMRLIIQENSPPFLKYNKDIEQDAAIVKQSYKNFSNELQKAVQDYAKNSLALKSLSVN